MPRACSPGGNRKRSPQPPQILDETTFVEAEEALGLRSPNQQLRDQLSFCVFDYVWACRHEPGKEKLGGKLLDAAVEEQFKQILNAARELQELIQTPTQLAASRSLKNHPKPDAAMVDMHRKAHKEQDLKSFRESLEFADHMKSIVWDQYWNLQQDKQGQGEALNHFRNMMGKNAPTPDRALAMRAVQHEVRRETIQGTGIYIEDLAAILDQLCKFVEQRNYKNKGGRPAREAWNVMMLKLADIFEDFKERRATSSKTQSKDYTGYRNPFVRFATIFEQATSSLAGVKKRSNSKLGSALAELLKKRQKAGLRKTR